MRLTVRAIWLIVGLAGFLHAQGIKPGAVGGADGRRVRLAGEQQMRQHKASIDVGDFYPTPQGPRTLRRSLDQVVVRGQNAAEAGNIARQVRERLPRLADAEEQPWGDGRLILRFGKHTADDVEDPRTRLAHIREQSGLPLDPVFVDPDSGLLMVVESQILVALGAQVNAETFWGEDGRRVAPLPGARNQYVITVETLTAEEILAECARLSERAEVVWAQPNFRCEGVKHFTPNDTYFNNQWHLKDGAAGSVAAQTAWDLTTGDGVIIAIIDDGVQTAHPDLQANMAPGRTNVLTGTTNVEPADREDNHGTAVAGVAAAVGHNALGVAGVAFKSRILPIKMATGNTYATDAQLATAFRHAAGLTGGPGWTGADVINFSWNWVASPALDSALADVAAHGRGGRGCPVFVSSGNSAADWAYISFPVTAGSHTFRFEYKKDSTESEGLDCIWIDDVYLPGVGNQGFEGASFPPSGWTTGGNANWRLNTQPEWAKGGGASGTQSARSGPITHSQSTWLQTVRTTTAGTVSFYVLTSTEYGYDVFNFYIDNVLKKFYSAGDPYTDPGGIYTELPVGYPANKASTIAVGASTDADQRAEYSQFGVGLDFVTPSGGGTRDIWTTDRTGADGYDPDSYMPDFDGTSSAAALASGIGALVLAQNPDLSAEDVRRVLRRSCAKIGGVVYAGGDAGAGGWNTYYGYGKLMASTAVQNAAGGSLQFDSATYAVTEAGGTVTVTVTRTGGSAGAAGVDIATSNGTAVAGLDYVTRSDTLAWTDGNADPRTFTVTILNDSAFEADETFTVTLSGVSGATLGTPAVATVTILDDDAAPPAGSIQLSAAAYSVAEDGGTVTITVTRTGNSQGEAGIRYATADGTATAGSDYLATSGDLTWADGDAADKRFTVTILDDSDYESPDETFTVTLSAPAGGAALGSPATATVTILDNDADPGMVVQIGSLILHNGGGTLDFGPAPIAGGTLTGTFTIRNSGTTPLHLTGAPRVEVTGSHAGDFSVTAAPASPVAPGETTAFTLVFAPSAQGIRSATLSIANNVADENPFIFGLQGTGDIAPAPTGLWTSAGKYTDRVTLSWHAMPGATHYRVFRAETPTGAKTVLGPWRSATFYHNYNPVPGKIYYYFIRAALDANGAGAGAYSASRSGYRKLAAPTGLWASAGKYTDRVTIAWQPVAGATHYRVFRAETPTGAKTVLGPWRNATFYHNYNPVPGQRYYYFIRAAAGPMGERPSAFSNYKSGWRARLKP